MEDTTRTAELRRKLEKDPGSRLFAQFAEELRKEGRHDEAISVARKGLEKNPNYPSARLTLARSLQDSGRPAEARPELEQVVKASPDNILAGRLLGEVLEELGLFDEALAEFERTLRFAPGDKAIVERIAGVKARMQAVAAPAASSLPGLAAEVPSLFKASTPAAPAPEVTPPAVTAPSVSVPPAVLPSVTVPSAAAPSVPMPSLAMPSVPMPSVPMPGIPSSAPPSVPIPELPAVGVPEAPAQSKAEVPAVAMPSVSTPSSPPQVAAVALDRDLASGTLSPGSMHVSELTFDAGPPAAAAPSPLLASEPTPAFEEPAAIDSDPGGSTLPLTSVTLADLYLQQGLKAEASAVLEQVMKDEPENVEAKSKLEAVSKAIEGPRPVDRGATEPAPPLTPPVTAAPAAKLTRAEIRERTILSLRAFQSAIEREALEQRATEQKAF